MTYFLHALVIAALMVGVPTLIVMWRNKNIERTLIIAVCLIVFWTGINWLILYTSYPIVGFNSNAFYQTYWLWALEIILSAIVVILAATEWSSYGGASAPKSGGIVLIVGILGILVFTCFWATGGRVWNQHRASSLANLVHVVKEPVGSYPNTDPNHILMVPEETATFEANNVLGSATKDNISTIFGLGAGTLQSVGQHLYWLYPLVPSGWRNSNRVHGASPGFVIVDAEDPNVPAQLKLGYHMRFFPGGKYDHSLARYLWTHGYSGSKLADMTLEVDDTWKPFFTVSVDRLTLNFKPMVPKAMLIVDPQTGKIQRHALNDIPDWVDRVYSQGTVKQMLNWWGEWGNAPYKFWSESSAGRFKVATGEDPVLVYTSTGHPVWQAILTSWNRDTSAAYLALFDARDNEVRLYQIPDLTLMSTAANTIFGSPSNLRKLEPAHMTLHRIYGQLTWVAPMISEVSTGRPNYAVQGLALMKANVLDGNSVALANSGNKADSLAIYRQKLAQGDNNAGPQQNSQDKTADGVVARVSQAIENNSSVYYFILAVDSTHVYRAALTTSLTGHLELPFIAAGAHVRITYTDVGGNTSRDVGSYDDLGLQLTK